MVKKCKYSGKYGLHPVFKKGNKYFSIHTYGNIIEINQVKKDRTMGFSFVKRKGIINKGLREEYGGLSERQAINLGKRKIGC